jgi:hypothetical protein
MLNVNYQKRKNTELFKSLENSDFLHLSHAQNYIPIYKKFFSLNETNFNSINLNNKLYISSINEQNEYDYHLYNCKIKNSINNKVKDKDVFFKLAPLLDPYKYLIGKYNIQDEKMFTLPKLNSTDNECHPKFIDENNSAYVDGLFLYLSSQLISNHNFIHGVDYYGSFLGIKNEFVINIFDDIDYLNNSEFFTKNKNILFKVDDYEHLFKNDKNLLKPITIQHNTSANSQLSIKSFNNDLFSNIFEESLEINENNETNEIMDETQTSLLMDLIDVNLLDKNDKTHVTLKSNSTCSSRSSYTDNSCTDEECDNCDSFNDENEEKKNSTDINEYYKEEIKDDTSTSSNSENDEEERIDAVIPKFPVQVITMEYCENTFDDLILNEELSPEEWYSAFMQIIMILLTYQKAFNFTHNDLHTNNVMYNTTDKKFIFYCYKKKYYKVPTFGRMFKMIDFGRSIYKFDGKLFCSDSFQIGGDAATQYNTEPYLNEKKPRLEPNFSFDLCRLACSIFDYVIDDFEEIKDITNCKDPIKRLIVEWCLDDKGINMLYKNNGSDRYPDFKLYKMISRCVHNHTPQAQLQRPEFDLFSKFKGEIPNDVIDIDKIPSCI